MFRLFLLLLLIVVCISDKNNFLTYLWNVKCFSPSIRRTDTFSNSTWYLSQKREVSGFSFHFHTYSKNFQICDFNDDRGTTIMKMFVMNEPVEWVCESFHLSQWEVSEIFQNFIIMNILLPHLHMKISLKYSYLLALSQPVSHLKMSSEIDIWC